MSKMGMGVAMVIACSWFSIEALSQPGHSSSGYQSFADLQGLAAMSQQASATTPAHVDQQPTAATTEAAPPPAPLTQLEEQMAQAIADSACRFECLQCCMLFRAAEDSTCRYAGPLLLGAGVALSGASIPAWLPVGLTPILQWVGLGSIISGYICREGSVYAHSRAEGDARILARVREILQERARS